MAEAFGYPTPIQVVRAGTVKVAPPDAHVEVLYDAENRIRGAAAWPWQRGSSASAGRARRQLTRQNWQQT